jgi:hypothetical protein
MNDGDTDELILADPPSLKTTAWFCALRKSNLETR